MSRSQLSWSFGYDAQAAANEVELPSAVPAGGVCHQRVVRNGVGRDPMPLRIRLNASQTLSFGFSFGRIPIDLGRAFIERYEWLGHAGRALIFYGMWRDGGLYGVEAFTPLPWGLAKSLGPLGEASKSLYLTRGACALAAGPHAGSMIVGASLRDLRRRRYWMVVAFSDERAGERGVVYRAANARFGGLTASPRTYYFVSGKWITDNHLSRRGLRVADLPENTPRRRELSPKRRFYWLLHRHAERSLPPSWKQEASHMKPTEHVISVKIEAVVYMAEDEDERLPALDSKDFALVALRHIIEQVEVGGLDGVTVEARPVESRPIGE